METLLARKKSVVVIRNSDQLCCARAIVTMKAWVDHGSCHPNYLNLRKGRPVQEMKAKELHRLADVPEGPCGLKELQKFQDALPGYQLKSWQWINPIPSYFAARLSRTNGFYSSK